MAKNFNDSKKDSTEIAELAALNEDISDDMLEQLSQQLTGNLDPSSVAHINENDDTTLFEETMPASEETSNTTEPIITEEVIPEINPIQEEIIAQDNIPETSSIEETPVKKEEPTVNKSFDDNFIKKYKAKLNKKAGKTDLYAEGETQQGAATSVDDGEPIENLSQGKIFEHPLTQELKEYNDSLDFLDGNVKYSKYVIYIDPQNVDFIEGLTVKERKNLINEILRQQDDITLTKRRFKVIQTMIRHIVIAILTLAISIPLVYYAINASLEATIDNHRRSQTNWQTLYKDHGKISQQ